MILAFPFHPIAHAKFSCAFGTMAVRMEIEFGFPLTEMLNLMGNYSHKCTVKMFQFEKAEIRLNYSPSMVQAV